MKLLNRALSMALLSSAPLLAQVVTEDPIAQLKSGEIQGRLISGGGAVFKGVPFAQPPIGGLRWRDPAPVKPWSGIRDAYAFGPACMQSPHPDQTNSEDCLYLNVWTPEWPAKSPKAVMVWLYGGSNITGTAALDIYDGTALSRRDIVVVTVNYRLGVFGFFAHPELTAESPHHSSGNYGLLDQLAALKWVHNNIAKFGGDPNRVTLFGQSSGAIDTSYLVASPLSKGLIQRAIQESGPPVRPIETLAQVEQQGVKFAASLKAPAGSADEVKFLRSMPSPELEKLAAAALGSDAVPLQDPLIDGYLIPKSPALIYRDAEELPIPVIVGNNARETTRSYKPEVMRRWIKDNFGSLAPKAEEFYGWANGGAGHDDSFFGPSTVQIRADVRDRCSAIGEGIWRSSHHHVTYEYMFDPPIAGEPATRHSAEIPFVFGNLLASGSLGGPFTEADRKISEQIQTYWINFAKTGDPNSKGLPAWPQFEAAKRPYLEFTLHDGPRVQENLRRNICDLYIDALKETIPANTAGDYPK